MMEVTNPTVKHERNVNTDNEKVRLERGIQQFEFENNQMEHLKGMPLLKRFLIIRRAIFGDIGNVKGFPPERLTFDGNRENYPTKKVVTTFFPEFIKFIDTQAEVLAVEDPQQIFRFCSVLFLFGIWIHNFPDGNAQTYRETILSYLREFKVTESFFPIKYAYDDATGLEKKGVNELGPLYEDFPEPASEADAQIMALFRLVEGVTGFAIDRLKKDPILFQTWKQSLEKSKLETHEAIIMLKEITEALRRIGVNFGQSVMPIDEETLADLDSQLETLQDSQYAKVMKISDVIDDKLQDYLRAHYPENNFIVRRLSTAESKEYIIKFALGNEQGQNLLGVFIGQGMEAANSYLQAENLPEKQQMIGKLLLDTLQVFSTDIEKATSIEDSTTRDKRYQTAKLALETL